MDQLKHVKIYSIGSCDYTSRKGHFEVLFQYGEHTKYLKKNVEDTTANRCILLGFIEGVRTLKYPCHVELISTTSVGLAGLKKNKGINIDLLKALIRGLSEKECEFTFSELIGKGEEVNALVRQHAP